MRSDLIGKGLLLDSASPLESHPAMSPTYLWEQPNPRWRQMAHFAHSFQRFLPPRLSTH
jgi:hypothetical protein